MSSSQETLRALESYRQRLHATSTSLAKIRHDLEFNDPLPSWTSLLTSLQLAQHNLLSLQNLHTNSQTALRSAHVYPLPSFPGRTQEPLLGQLLRKKLQPGVEDWIADGEKKAASSLLSEDTGSDTAAEKTTAIPETLTVAQLEHLWNWAGPEANRIAREDIGAEGWDDVFTLAESDAGIENVVTGLRRKLWESDDEGSDDDDDDEAEKKMKTDDDNDGDAMNIDGEDKVKKEKQTTSTTIEWGGMDRGSKIMMARPFDESSTPLPLETMLRYSLTGQLPPSVPAGGMPIRR
ncbi:hypothetical protein AAFC00_002426 [Neodothiora populina]|uniref:Mediator of RNA polymerase II transcription subunit 8 n=1 Tax=Neodothiora populina TaxID=2781224 RepID=A0ABR3P8E9_9PEZI